VKIPRKVLAAKDRSKDFFNENLKETVKEKTVRSERREYLIKCLVLKFVF
jgi:hypothetical protein